MILEIDAGNSRIKWRLQREDAGIRDRGICVTIAELQNILPTIDRLHRVRLASVRGRDFTSDLVESIQLRWQVTAEVAQVAPIQAGVHNAYRKFETFGVDRWLAMLAAYNRHHDRCCIISCGTALTLDVVSETGIHQGGFIIPGLSLQRKSLLENTSIRLPAASQWSSAWSSVALGCSTEDAVNHGIFTMLLGGILNYPGIAEIGAAGGLYLTGGDAEVISAGLKRYDITHSCDQDIILDGLALVLP
jgi:type III pantothenate kinase